MTGVALDASALLAMPLDEPGGEKVKAVLDGALLGAVNLAEVVSHYARLDAALSYDAGMPRPLTLPGGLSLGDRYCLALARREGVPALTAERRWPDIAATACVTVELIRWDARGPPPSRPPCFRRSRISRPPRPRPAPPQRPARRAATFPRTARSMAPS